MCRRNRCGKWVLGSSRPGNFSGLKWFRHYPLPQGLGSCPGLHRRVVTPGKKNTLFQSPFSPVAQVLTSLIVEILECQIFGISGSWSCTMGPCGWLSLSPIFLWGGVWFAPGCAGTGPAQAKPLPPSTTAPSRRWISTLEHYIYAFFFFKLVNLPRNE